MSATLRGNAIDYKKGVTFKERLTEDLDEGTIIFPQVAETDIEPLDQIVITDTGFSKNANVSQFRRVTSDFNTPTYNYTVGLTSPTIQLQRIVLPNRSVTQPLTGTKLTGYDVFNRYVTLYASSFTISSALETLLDSFDCPEFQWNRPTLFEVANDILSEEDCVVTMTSFTTISYLDLNATGDAIVASDNLTISEVIQEQSLIDYADKLDAEIENAIVNYKNTNVIEWITLKTDEDAIVTTENAKIILEKPVYKINKITARIAITRLSFTVREADLTDYIVEKSVYDLYAPSDSTGYITGTDYKRNAFYYTEGSNIIEGLTYKEDTWLSMSSKSALINVFRNAYLAQESYDLASDFVNDDIYDFVFKVEYTAQETVKVISNKQNTITNSSTLLNNQDTSYVDFNAFANKQQFTANRLANDTLEIHGRATTYSYIPALCDTYDTDYKVYEREYTLHEAGYNFVLKCAKNYVLKDIFTGIKQERRFTSLAKGSEAFECNHNTQHTFNLSQTDATSSSSIENYMLGMAEADENIKLVYFKTDSNTVLGISPSAYYSNKHLYLVFKMQDNVSAGIKVDSSWEFGTGTHYGIAFAKYVDDNGNFTSYIYKLYKKYTIPILNLDTLTTANWASGLEVSREFPEIDVSYLDSGDLIYTSGTITRYKDNREITVETIQYNFTNDSNVFYGNKFFINHNMVYTDSTDTTLYVAYSTTETYTDGDQVKVGTIADAGSLTYSITNNALTINSPDTSLTISTFTSWAICDVDGNIYIANNGNNDTIYMNKE